MRTAHPRDVLLGAQGAAGVLPVCDHYCGVEARMRKSLQLQADLTEQFGACVFDVTLDCEDGAPVGGEAEHAQMVAEIARTARHPRRRVGARVHAVDHAAFASDVRTIVGGAGDALAYLMVPKIESLADVQQAVAAIDAASFADAVPLPLHVLVESPAAVQRVFEIAAHPRVQSVSFGLMDFVSAHAGAIPASAMGVGQGVDAALDQFHHPLVVRAKTDIASACHAWGKVPSHCVVTEFKDRAALARAARMASQAFGYTRMWSIHPDQILPILDAFAPSAEEIDLAVRIVQRAQDSDWAPVSVDGRLHDRASYRYFWQVLDRAHQTGRTIPDAALGWFAPASTGE